MDYTYGENAQATQQAQGSYWWKKEKSDVHSAIFSILKHFEKTQGPRKLRNLQAMKMYGNMEMTGLSAYNHFQSGTASQAQGRLALNIAKSMADTVTQKIAKNKPKPMFLTSGGDWQLKSKAKKLNKFIEGIFYETNAYKMTRTSFLDSTVMDIGILHPYKQDGRIKIERVFPQELEVDENEAFSGDPRSCYRTKFIAREVLLERFKGKEAVIMAAAAAKSNFTPHPNLPNMVQIAEAFHLPSRKGATDGRHVICLENGPLLDEGYNRSYFPFVIQRWGNRLIGWYGQSLVEQIAGLQIEINKTLRTIQLSLHLLGIPKWLVEHGSKIIKAHLNNEVGGIIEWSGTAPAIQVFQAVPPQLIEHLEYLRQRAYEISGVGELSAQAKKPAGLNSGKALREFNDIESDRFLTAGQDYEDTHLELGRHCIDLAKEISEEKESQGYAVKTPNGRFFDSINWKEIAIAEDDYIMQMFPTSALSNTPAGRLQDVQELAQAGVIQPKRMASLLDFPDLESEMSLMNAPIDDLELQIDRCIEKGEYLAPEPYQDLQMGIQMFQSAYLRAKVDGVPEERLELLRRWMDQAKGELDKVAADQAQKQAAAQLAAQAAANPPAPPGPGLAPGAPQAVPQPPPTSELLPTAA